jgi:acyl carrier protein
MQDTIRRFIIEHFLAGEDDPDFSNEDSFIETRVIDSTGVLELVEFVEETYGIKVDDADLVPENFDSVTLVAAYVQRKRS